LARTPKAVAPKIVAAAAPLKRTVKAAPKPAAKAPAKVTKPAPRAVAKATPVRRKPAVVAAPPKRSKEELVALVAKHERTILRLKEQRKLAQAEALEVQQRVDDMEKAVSKLEKQAVSKPAAPNAAPVRRTKKVAAASIAPAETTED
jgi:predicted metal-dependent hydrolase